MTMDLPALPYDFRDALIDRIEFGPRREFTIRTQIAVWKGPSMTDRKPVAVRFGGVENLDEMRNAFLASPHEHSELASLRYSDKQKSKRGRLFFTIEFERIDLRLEVRCSNMVIL